MNRDLEEFLKKAAERRNQKQAQRRAPVQSPPPANAQPLSQSGSENRPSSPPKPQKPARPVGSSPKGTPPKTTASPLGNSSIGTLSQSSSNVDQADERMADHLHQAFDHAFGDIAAPTTSSTADESPEVKQAEGLGKEILAMLRDPASVQRAIVLREILERPEHLWD